MHGTVRAEQNEQANTRAHQQSSEHGSRGKGALQIQLSKNNRRGAIGNKAHDCRDHHREVRIRGNEGSERVFANAVDNDFKRKRNEEYEQRDLQRMHQRALRNSAEAMGVVMRVIVGMGVIMGMFVLVAMSMLEDMIMAVLGSLVGSARKFSLAFFGVRKPAIRIVSTISGAFPMLLARIRKRRRRIAFIVAAAVVALTQIMDAHRFYSMVAKSQHRINGKAGNKAAKRFDCKNLNNKLHWRLRGNHDGQHLIAR